MGLWGIVTETVRAQFEMDTFSLLQYEVLYDK
jgi:hypothetical protein